MNSAVEGLYQRQEGDLDECSCRRDDWAEQLDETLEIDYRFSDSLDAGERGN